MDWCLQIAGLQTYLFRRTYPELEKNHILPSITEFAFLKKNKDAVFKKQDKRWEFSNGSMLHFCHAQYELDVAMYHGAEIHVLAIDELTSFTEYMFDYLRGRTRCALSIPKEFQHKIPSIVCCTNPGGIGHQWVKKRFVDFCEITDSNIYDYQRTNQPIYEVRNSKKETLKKYGLKQAADMDGGMLRAYIPALLEDNPTLTKADPKYRLRIEAMPEPLRTAWLYGDWSIFLGQAFDFQVNYHVCNPRPIPDYVPLYMTFDWGYAAPFSIGWWWEDQDHRLYRFAEDYGWNGTPNQGLRLTDSEIAERIIKKEKELGIEGRYVLRISDPTCFNKKPDYKGGGQGPSTAEVFRKYSLDLRPGDANRVLKIRQFHERLRIPEDKTLPMVQIYPGCEQFIRTIRELQSDPKKPEDIVTLNVEDHIYDEAVLMFMARTLDMFDDIKEMKEKLSWDAKMAELDPESKRAAENLRSLKERLNENENDRIRYY